MQISFPSRLTVKLSKDIISAFNGAAQEKQSGNEKDLILKAKKFFVKSQTKIPASPLKTAFFSALVTAAFIEFTQISATVVDSAVVSHFIGTDAMTAVGLGYPFFSIVGIVGGILSMGMQSLCAEEIGRGNFKQFNTVQSTTLIVGLICSVLLSACAFLFIDPLTRLLGANGKSAELFQPTKEYIMGLSIGVPAMVIVSIFAPAIQLDNNAAIVRKAALTDAAADIILDIVLIKTGFGLFGMGIATSAARYLNLIILFTHFSRKDRVLRPSFHSVSFRTLGQVVSKGGMIGARRLANVIRPIMVNNFIISLGGTAAMAALSVKNTVNNFANVFACGICDAVPLVMGIAAGEKSKDDMLYVGKLIHRATFFITGAVSILLLIFASPIASLFVGTDTGLHTMTVFSICTAAAELGIFTLISCRVAYLSVISKYLENQILQFSLSLIAVVPSILMMGRLFGVYGVLSGITAAYIVLLLVIYIVNAFHAKKVRLTPTDFLRLDESFDILPSDVIELSIRNQKDAALVAEQIQLFCKGHQIDRRKGYYAALSLEESARIIFENNAASAKLYVDIRLIIRDGDIILRIRDNGNSAFPFGGLDEDEAADYIFANIGIRMMRKIAKHIDYYHTLKINYTILTV